MRQSQTTETIDPFSLPLRRIAQVSAKTGLLIRRFGVRFPGGPPFSPNSIFGLEFISNVSAVARKWTFGRSDASKRELIPVTIFIK